jgi:hypothetical protein
MRSMLINTFLLVLVGCASQNASPPLAQRQYADRPGAALAFDPPVLQGRAAAELPRDLLEPGAFVSYDDTSITYFNIRTDDRLGEGSDVWLYRRAVIERTGVSFR